MLETGSSFTLDSDEAPGNASRVQLPHPELFVAVGIGDKLLIDDGKVRLVITSVEPGGSTRGSRSAARSANKKGVNVPGVLVPIPALTDKDRSRPSVRARARGRLDRIVVRPAARGRRRSARFDRRPGGADGQDREAGGDRAAGRDSRAGRRGDGRARRPWRRDSARRRAADAEPDHRARPATRQAGGGGDADARIDDRLADPDAGRGQRRRDRDLRRRPTRSCCRRKARRGNIRSRRWR